MFMDLCSVSAKSMGVEFPGTLSSCEWCLAGKVFMKPIPKKMKFTGTRTLVTFMMIFLNPRKRGLQVESNMYFFRDRFFRNIWAYFLSEEGETASVLAREFLSDTQTDGYVEV